MREILFRGKVTDDHWYADLRGKWVEGNLVHQTEHYGSPVDRYHILYTGEFHCDYYDSAEVIPETIGQFTGLTDMNGMKIFEGDIVNTRHGIRYIVFEDGCFCARKPNSRLCGNMRSYMREIKGDIEIIGNIYDNPELLERTREYMGDLRPCPFCGGEVVPFHAKSDELQIDLGYRFFCKNDCCMQVRFYKTKQEAVEAWNTRIDYEGEKLYISNPELLEGT